MLGRKKTQSPEEFKANLHKGQNIANARKAATPKDEVAAQRAKNGGKK
jgi:hypothetical protein